jgi:large subunit ribosomal protein L21
MYAIIKTGGKQYRIEEGNEIKVEKLAGEPGSEVVLDQVLAVGSGSEIKYGQPFVDGAKVSCEIRDHGRARKVVVFKKKRRKDYRKKQGHRQEFTTIKIKAIEA